jgi:hypothetical protein
MDNRLLFAHLGHPLYMAVRITTTAATAKAMAIPFVMASFSA